MTIAVAKLDTLDRLRLAVSRGGLRADDLEGLVTYSVGDYVWARWGQSRSVQLARVAMAAPVSFHGGRPDWWYLQIYWQRQAAWRDLGTHRRVYRALHPMELPPAPRRGGDRAMKTLIPSFVLRVAQNLEDEPLSDFLRLTSVLMEHGRELLISAAPEALGRELDDVLKPFIAEMLRRAIELETLPPSRGNA